jgi:hypothetical protein
MRAWGRTSADAKMTTPVTADERDALVLRLLAVMPGVQRWANAPLPPDIRQWLAGAEHDELVSAIATALLRLAGEHRGY